MKGNVVICLWCGGKTEAWVSEYLASSTMLLFSCCEISAKPLFVFPLCYLPANNIWNSVSLNTLWIALCQDEGTIMAGAL